MTSTGTDLDTIRTALDVARDAAQITKLRRVDLDDTDLYPHLNCWAAGTLDAERLARVIDFCEQPELQGLVDGRVHASWMLADGVWLFADIDPALVDYPRQPEPTLKPGWDGLDDDDPGDDDPGPIHDTWAEDRGER